MVFRTGDVKSLVSEFIRMKEESLHFEYSFIENPDELEADRILAVHYANAGAQGESGAVNILYRSQYGVQVLRGNYVYGGLNIDAVIQKLPVLNSLRSRESLESLYLFGDNRDTSADWGYLYMGAGNHYFARSLICDKIQSFIHNLLTNGGYLWQVFEAVAWFCMAQCISCDFDS